MQGLLAESKNKNPKKAPMPSFVEPMLATLTEEYFDNPEWIFERKLDGERVLSFIDSQRINIFSRNRKNLNKHYPEIIDSLRKIKGRAILDGEVVAFRGEATSFEELQDRMGLSNEQDIKRVNIPIFYYLFDILYLDQSDLREFPLVERKKILQEVMTGSKGPIRILDFKEAEGLIYLEHACKEKWEGLIAKEKNSKYESKRSKKWLKFKCSNEQEFIIIGFTKPQGKRVGFGALLLGYYDESGKIRYAGKVGTGYDEKFLKEFYAKLEKIKMQEDLGLEEKGVYAVKPKFVAQIRFTEWTKEGKLRHPVFLGLRDDKTPSEVSRENK